MRPCIALTWCATLAVLSACGAGGDAPAATPTATPAASGLLVGEAVAGADKAFCQAVTAAEALKPAGAVDISSLTKYANGVDAVVASRPPVGAVFWVATARLARAAATGQAPNITDRQTTLDQFPAAASDVRVRCGIDIG